MELIILMGFQKKDHCLMLWVPPFPCYCATILCKIFWKSREQIRWKRLILDFSLLKVLSSMHIPFHWRPVEAVNYLVPSYIAQMVALFPPWALAYCSKSLSVPQYSAGGLYYSHISYVGEDTAVLFIPDLGWNAGHIPFSMTPARQPTPTNTSLWVFIHMSEVEMSF